MPILIGNRKDVVKSLSGHVAGFEAGKETFVPNIPAFIKECTNRGHVIKKDEPAKPAPAPAPAPTKSAPSTSKTTTNKA